MSLNRFNEGLAMSKTLADKENPEPFALAYAARFSGAVGDKKSAVSYILKLSAQSALEAGLLLDFGRYVFENGGEGDFRDFIKNIESKGGALNLSMSKLLQGEAAYSKGDKAAAKNFAGISFVAKGGKMVLSGTASVQIFLDIACAKFNHRRAAFDYAADRRAVAFSKRGHFKYFTEYTSHTFIQTKPTPISRI